MGAIPSSADDPRLQTVLDNKKSFARRFDFILVEDLNISKTDMKVLAKLSDTTKAKFWQEFGLNSQKTLGSLVGKNVEKPSVEVSVVKKDGTTQRAVNSITEMVSPDLMKLEEKDIKKIAKNKSYSNSTKASFERVEKAGKGYHCLRCERFYTSAGSQMTDSGVLFHPDKKDKSKHCFSYLIIEDGKIVDSSIEPDKDGKREELKRNF